MAPALRLLGGLVLAVFRVGQARAQTLAPPDEQEERAGSSSEDYAIVVGVALAVLLFIMCFGGAISRTCARRREKRRERAERRAADDEKKRHNAAVRAANLASALGKAEDAKRRRAGLPLVGESVDSADSASGDEDPLAALLGWSDDDDDDNNLSYSESDSGARAESSDPDHSGPEDAGPGAEARGGVYGELIASSQRIALTPAANATPAPPAPPTPSATTPDAAASATPSAQPNQGIVRSRPTSWERPEAPACLQHDGSPLSVLAAHSVGEASRSDATKILQGRGCILPGDPPRLAAVAGDFVLRRSKGGVVLSLVRGDGTCTHKRLRIDGARVLVNGRAASAPGSTVAEAVDWWLSSAARARSDLRSKLVDVGPCWPDADVGTGAGGARVSDAGSRPSQPSMLDRSSGPDLCELRQHTDFGPGARQQLGQTPLQRPTSWEGLHETPHHLAAAQTPDEALAAHSLGELSRAEAEMVLAGRGWIAVPRATAATVLRPVAGLSPCHASVAARTCSPSSNTRKHAHARARTWTGGLT